MAKGKALTVILLLAALAGGLLWRRRAARRERVDLYFADGSMVSLEQDALDAERLLPLAHSVIQAARESR
jgi:hypothetical protein